MAKPLGPFGEFKGRASRAQNGVAVIFDLEGFSKFFNQPDVHEYIPIYLNRVIEAIERSFFGGETIWLENKKTNTMLPLSVLPIHRKFLGDGMLYVWSFADVADSTVATFTSQLCNRLWNTKNWFGRLNHACSEVIPVSDLPARIRFGVARGTIYELSVANTSSKEYIGFCINLASRLQSYCPNLGFIASGRLSIKDLHLSQFNYTKVAATKIKGFPKEIVIVDKDEYDQVPEEIKKDLFESV